MKELCNKIKGIKSLDATLVKNVESKLEEWKAEKARSAANNKMQIACVGIYNAGKSTLLNSLIGKQVFLSGDVPTTDSLDRYDAGNVVYIDTPGLNANDADNATAFKGYKESDLILFVSNAQNGGLNAAEAKYLQELKAVLGNAKMLEEHVVFILSNKHRVDAANLDKIVAQHKQNIEDVFGIELSKIYACDSVTYESGMTQKEELLIEASGMMELKARIDELLNRKASQLRQERVVVKKVELEEALVKLRADVKEKAELLNQGAKVLSSQLKDIETLKVSQRKAMEDLKGKLVISEEAPRLSYIYFEHIGSISNKKSEYEIKSYIRTKVESRYNKRESMVRREVSELSEYYTQYLEYAQQDGNYFYDRNTLATKLVLDYANQLKKYGIKVPTELVKEIQFLPENASSIMSTMRADLADDVVQYGQYYSVNYYADLVDIEEYEDYSRKGLFGGTKYTYSAYNTYDAIDEMKRDITKNLDGNIHSLWNRIKNVIKNYNEKVEKELNNRVQKLEQLIETHKKSLKVADSQKEQAIISEVVQLLDKAVEDLKCA